MNSYPGRKRKFIILGLLFVGMILSFFDRLAINVGIIPIEEEFQLNPSQTGLLISAFFFSYSIMQLLGGWLTDKFGARIMITISLISWSVFTMLTGFAWSFSSLLCIRFLFGLGEGPFHSAAILSIYETFPEKERGRANSFFMSAQSIGGVLGSVVAASLIVILGWRGMFISLGIPGFFIAFIFWFVLKPQDIKTIEKSNQKMNKVALKELFKLDNTWKIVFTKFFASIVNWGLISWMPIYLVKEKGLDLVSAGGLIVIPYIASFIMFNLNGWLLDKYMIGTEKYLVITGSVLTAVFIILMSNATNVAFFITFFTLTAMSISFIGTTLLTIVLKYGPKEVIGSISGLVSFSSQVAGAISPAVIGLIISFFNGSYDAAFWLLVVSACLAAVIGFTLNSNNKTHSSRKQIKKAISN
ncbi:MFS transporter [Bacillus wiedmannii]|uniref:MFS transporter n=1 Tax=Bacillus wiedmannii TaxID=1890302 RepID=UPI00094B3E18|nr:MFS transporter [Bacillus wiedmannii]MBZ4225903.1 MFS transporter [Bacillus wiedmannii]MED2935009.1 MFS transporter [Bacillus wiedmannii]